MFACCLCGVRSHEKIAASDAVPDWAEYEKMIDENDIEADVPAGNCCGPCNPVAKAFPIPFADLCRLARILEFAHIIYTP